MKVPCTTLPRSIGADHSYAGPISHWTVSMWPPAAAAAPFIPTELDDDETARALPRQQEAAVLSARIDIDAGYIPECIDSQRTGAHSARKVDSRQVTSL